MPKGRTNYKDEPSSGRYGDAHFEIGKDRGRKQQAATRDRVEASFLAETTSTAAQDLADDVAQLQPTTFDAELDRVARAIMETKSDVKAVAGCGRHDNGAASKSMEGNLRAVVQKIERGLLIFERDHGDDGRV